MKKAETISWIFLALAISPKNSLVNLAEIFQIADGINHSVPKEKKCMFL